MATYPLPAAFPFGFPVVLDTNTILALWMFQDPALPRLRAAADSGHLILVTRDDCLEELAKVLAYRQFGQSPEQQAALLAAYTELSRPVEKDDWPVWELPRCLDRDDQKFLELARDSGVPLLVTRDKLLLKLARRPAIAAHFAIITPEKLETLLAAQAEARALGTDTPATC